MRYELQRARVKFECADFFDPRITPPLGPDLLVYCDPPYFGTTEYVDAEAFSTRAFWLRAHDLAAFGARVFVSEYTPPTQNLYVPTRLVWEQTRRGNLCRDQPRAERLYEVLK